MLGKKIIRWNGAVMLTAIAGFGLLVLCEVAWAVDANGLVAHWKLDEGEGDIAYDSAGDNDGTLISGPEWTSGQIDGALRFDGVDDFVEVRDSGPLDSLNEITILSWIYLHSKALHNVIVAKATTFNNGYYFLVNKAGEGGVLVVNVGEGSNYLRGPIIDTGKWYHVACTFDAEAERLYVNGGKVRDRAPLVSSIRPSGSDLRIGLSTTGYWDTHHFNGIIDDVLIYDRALSVEEILQLCQEGFGGRAINPKPFDGAAGVDPNVSLSWMPGTYAVSHDVYFGTNYNDVNDADTSWSEYKGNQEPNSYYPGPLELGTTYYWRIDEVNDSSVVHKGNIWSFQTDLVVLFEEDFEDGNADRWSFGPLYGDAEFHVEAEGDNYVLSGSGHAHANPVVDGWANYSFKCEVKFIGGNGGVHLNYRQTSTGERYFIGFTPAGIYLNKTKPPGNHINLIYLNEKHYYGQWYIAEIVGVENNIKVYVDRVCKIDYTDNDPIYWGTFGLETLDDSHIHFDNIIVRGEKPPTLDVEWVRTGGPSGGLGYDVRIHPSDKNIMFVTDNPSGVNKSYDCGDTWVQRNAGISTRTGPSGDGIPIFSLTIDPSNPEIVWAGTQNAKGIYKSTDGGETWAKKDNGVIEGDEISFRNFGIHPYDSNIVFAGAEISTGILGIEFDKTKGKIYKTEDGGENWRCVWEGDNLARFVLFDRTDPNAMYASTGIFDREAYNGSGVGILKSNDGGENWFQINAGLRNRFIGFLEIHPNNPRIILAAAGNNVHRSYSGVYRTVYYGARWAKVLGSDHSITVVTFSPSNPNVIYAGGEVAFYRSDDGGNTWRQYQKPGGGYGPPGIRAGIPISAVVDPDDPMTVFVNNYNGGNFKSTDGGQTWVNSSKGYTGADLHDIAIYAGNPDIVYTIGRSGPFRSLNGGEDWTGIAFDPANQPEWYAVALNPANPQQVLISDEFNGSIYKSTNEGRSWRIVFRHPDAGQGGPQESRHGFKDIVYAPSNPNIVYAGMRKGRRSINGDFPPRPSFGMCKSTDSGETWFEINTGLGTPLININAIAIDPTNPNIVYVGTWIDGVFKTTDGGQNWVMKNNGLVSSDVRSLAIDPQDPNVVYAGLGEGAGVAKSTNGGELWGEINNGISIECPSYLLPAGKVNIGVSLEEIPRRRIGVDYYSVPWTSVRSIVIDPTNSQTIYAADYRSGVYMSSDGGNTWYVANEGLSTRAVSALAISADGGLLYAATSGEGVFRLTRAAPVACIFGGDKTVEAGAGCEARVTLDGSCSGDPDSSPGTNDDIEYFDWYEQIDPCDPNADILLGSGEVIDCNLPLGEYTIVLKVTDKADASDSNQVAIVVEDTTPPVIVCPGDITVAARVPTGAVVTFTTTATDLCDSIPEVICSTASGSTFPCGVTEVTCTATDTSGNTSSCTFTVTITEPIEILMKFTPQAFNPGSQGNWVKLHFVLPEGYGVEDVDGNEPVACRLMDTGDVIESEYVNVFVNEEGVVEVEAGFERGDFGLCLSQPAERTFTVMGMLAGTGGQDFYGTDSIRITNKALEQIAGLASYWLAQSCARADWCGGFDLDHNGVVNFVDFALTDGCCVEVIGD